jgi:hypothetical protein
MTEIKFDDIRKGDYIEVVWERNDRTDTSRGIAARKDDNGWWKTPQGEVLVTRNDDGTILLRHRPVLPEPDGLGAIVRTSEGIEYVSVNRQPGTPRWVEAMADDVFGERWPIRWDDLVFDFDSIEVEP